MRRNNRGGISSKGEDEENFALIGKGKKGEGNKSQNKPKSSQGLKNKGLSKIKCFICHEFKHYATKFTHKNSNKKNSRGAAGEALASQLKLDFTLIVCMVSTMMGNLWYLDLGASFHMTGYRDFFSDLEEKDLHMHIDLGDHRRYNVIGIGIVTFKRESGSPIYLKDVMFVPGLKKNLISVAILEDHGYDVISSKGKSFLRHIVTRKVKQIRLHVKNMYKLDVEDCGALSSNVEKLQSRNVCELSHRILGHLRHGALKNMQ